VARRRYEPGEIIARLRQSKIFGPRDKVADDDLLPLMALTESSLLPYTS